MQTKTTTDAAHRHLGTPIRDALHELMEARDSAHSASVEIDVDGALAELREALRDSAEEREYTIRADGGEDTITASSLADALQQAKEWAREGLDADLTTVWSTVYVDGEDGTSDQVSVSLDPTEPDCADGHSHDWQSPLSLVGGIAENPGVQGHGAGVIMREVCSACGTYRTTDTYAQNPETGEQGLTSVSYEEADEDSEAWVAERIAAAAED
jgi:hypothetical protein